MTKNLYPAPGQIILQCRVSSISGRRVFTTVEIGTNSMMNVAREYKDKVANAKLSSIYKHMAKGGSSNAQVEVIDYDIKYLDKKFGVRRRKEYESVPIRNEKGRVIGEEIKTYAVAYDKTNGKRLGKRILRRGEPIE